MIRLLQSRVIALDERLDNKFDGDFVNSFYVVGVAVAERWRNGSEKRLFDFLKETKKTEKIIILPEVFPAPT